MCGRVFPRRARGLTGMPYAAGFRPSVLSYVPVSGRSTRRASNPWSCCRSATESSHKTAGAHVSSILAKLGVARRVEAAAIAERLDLLEGLAPEATR
jgi:hypothetical protein